jgi:hypothetical protein
VAVDVLHHHDAVVHKHAQGQDQGEEHDHVQGHAHGLEHGEGDEHGQRDGQGHEQRRAPADEQQDHGQHQHQPEMMLFLQVGEHALDVLGLVGGQRHGQRGRHLLVQLLHGGAQGRDDLHHVLAAALGDGHGDAVLPVHAGLGLLVLGGVLDAGHVVQVHGLAPRA